MALFASIFSSCNEDSSSFIDEPSDHALQGRGEATEVRASTPYDLSTVLDKVSNGGKTEQVSLSHLPLFIDDIYAPYVQEVKDISSISRVAVKDSFPSSKTMLTADVVAQLIDDRHKEFYAVYGALSSDKSFLYSDSKLLSNGSIQVLQSNFYIVEGGTAQATDEEEACEGAFDDADCWVSSPYINGEPDEFESGDCNGMNLDENAQSMVERAINSAVPRFIPGSKFEEGKHIVYKDVECISLDAFSGELSGLDISADWDCCSPFPLYEPYASTLQGNELNCYQAFIRAAIQNKIPEGFVLVSTTLRSDFVIEEDVPMHWFVEEYCFGRPVTVSVVAVAEQVPQQSTDLIGN